jgi:hypothetical protein
MAAALWNMCRVLVLTGNCVMEVILIDLHIDGSSEFKILMHLRPPSLIIATVSFLVLL